MISVSRSAWAWPLPLATSGERRTVEDVRRLILRGPPVPDRKGGPDKPGPALRLADVADVGREESAMAIQRENARRKAVVSANVADGYNLGQLVGQARAKVDPIVARYGFAVHYGGQFEAQQSASRTIYTMGAAVVLATMSLLPALRPKVKVIGYLCCTDNMPSGSALKLGDVLTIRNGKTVEIHNTDAEGRLVLADGLSLAVEDEVDAVVALGRVERLLVGVELVDERDHLGLVGRFEGDLHGRAG